MTSYIHKEVHDKGDCLEWVEYVYFYDTHIRLWTVTKYRTK